LAERLHCARTAREQAEPRYGTASTVTRWILVEQPGPWGENAVLDSDLPHKVGATLRARAGRVAARVLLIRRHGRYSPLVRSCFVAATAGSPWVERLTFNDPTELLTVDWSPLRDHRSVGGRAVDRPMYLVCTNGRHDPCCAEYGRPLAAALASALGEELWESSHFGGDRFAGNLVCLPHGLYFGHVGAAEGASVTAAYAAGRIDLDHFRGRSAYPFPVQAAEFFLRRATANDAVDDLPLQDWEEVSAGTRATFRDAGGGVHRVTVAVNQDPPRPLTCRAGRLGRPARYRLVALESA
jgi:hypothetical protein